MLFLTLFFNILFYYVLGECMLTQSSPVNVSKSIYMIVNVEETLQKIYYTKINYTVESYPKFLNILMKIMESVCILSLIWKNTELMMRILMFGFNMILKMKFVQLLVNIMVESKYIVKNMEDYNEWK